MDHVLKRTFQLNFKCIWVQTKQKFTHIYMLSACMLSHYSRVHLFASPWTIACQASLSMGSSRKAY